VLAVHLGAPFGIATSGFFLQQRLAVWTKFFQDHPLRVMVVQMSERWLAQEATTHASHDLFLAAAVVVVSRLFLACGCVTGVSSELSAPLRFDFPPSSATIRRGYRAHNMRADTTATPGLGLCLREMRYAC
jgi:hypothetical protein